jgi:hypothetical protein
MSILFWLFIGPAVVIGWVAMDWLFETLGEL